MEKFTLSLIVLTSIVSAGWWNTYGGADTDVGYWVEQTWDGGYVITGTTSSYSNGESDLWVVRTDSRGEMCWQKNYGGEDTEWGVCLQQTADEGFIVTGWTKSCGAGSFDLWLVKIDQAGDTLWTRTYGGEGKDHGRAVRQTSDGSYVIAGHTDSYGSGEADMWLLKTDGEGKRVWMQTYGGERVDYGWSVEETDDYGYILTGYTQSFGEGGNDLWLVKTNHSGDSVWGFTWGGPHNDWGNCVEQTTDGGYIVSGTTESHGSGGVDGCLVKVSAQGQLEWANTYGTPANEGFYCVRQTSDEGYVLTGWMTPEEASSLWLVKTDAQGVIEWTRDFGGEEADFGTCVQETSDGGFILTGATSSYGAGHSDVWLIKTNSEGSLAVLDNQMAVSSPETWEIINPAGQTISLRYWDCSAGFHAAVFNAAGQKVDEVRASGSSGSITWGESHGPGVYFVRELSRGTSHSVVLVR